MRLLFPMFNRRAAVVAMVMAICLWLPGIAAGRPYEAGRFVGRIAYSADGNHNDPDDWAASPVALAIFSAAGLKDQLAHFHYNSILPQTNPEWEKIHAESVLGAVQHYGFDRTRFFDCHQNLEGAIAHLTAAINASTAQDPLYLVIAGPVEVPARALMQADPTRRQFVTCVSHSRWNDGFSPKYKFAATKRTLIDGGVHWVQIGNQNTLLSTSPYGRKATPEEFAPFFWMRDSSQPANRFLWARMQVSTRPDVSDAGMAWFVVTGDETCDPAKLKRLVDEHQKPAIILTRDPIRIEAENFRTLDDFGIAFHDDAKASHRLEVALMAGKQRGAIRMPFEEPFVAARGRYDIEVRYFDEKYVQTRFEVFVNGKPRGEAWKSAGAGGGWSSYTIKDVAVAHGDELRIEAIGPTARLDFVQLNRASGSP